MELARRSAINNAAMQAFYLRQSERAMEKLNRQQTCTYNGMTSGGMTSGTATCY